MRITDQDKEVIGSMFPRLVFEHNDHAEALVGELPFAAKFLEDLGKYELYNPSEPPADCIRGEFEIKVNLSAANPYREVYETGGKLALLAKDLGQGLEAIHAKAS